MTVFDAHSNFAYSTVAGAPGLAGTQMEVQPADYAQFPAPPFNMTCWPPGISPTASVSEIVRVTAVNQVLFTIVREQEGTTGQNIVAGWQVAAGPTAKTLTDVEAAASGAVSTSLQKASNLSDVSDAGTSRLNIHVAELAVCQVAATSNITLSGLQTIDGYTTLSGDLVLCTGQSTALQNGPWLASSSAWTRPHEYATGALIVAGRTVSVVNGTVNAKSHWILTTAGTVTVDTTATTWVQNLPGSVINGTSATVTTVGTVSSPTEFLDATSAGFTRTLPTAVGFQSEYVLEAITAGTHFVTINTSGGQTVGGYASGALTLGTQASGAPYQAVTLRSDGANWQIV